MTRPSGSSRTLETAPMGSFVTDCAVVMRRTGGPTLSTGIGADGGIIALGDIAPTPPGTGAPGIAPGGVPLPGAGAAGATTGELAGGGLAVSAWATATCAHAASAMN